MVVGPPNFSAPVDTSKACRRWKYAPFSLVMATTYIVPVFASITGVLVIPISGVAMSGQLTSAMGTGVTPDDRKLTVHNGVALVPLLLSASNTYTLSCWVTTYTTL